ncbi:hypothetical protein C8F01DRAFT_1097997 [Mycena amicta]|nr:hypothetical protein C8F01DRAFT_1097997 [Mycena amicta]
MHAQTRYVFYNAPTQPPTHPPAHQEQPPVTTVSPQDTQRTPVSASAKSKSKATKPNASASTSSAPPPQAASSTSTSAPTPVTTHATPTSTRTPNPPKPHPQPQPIVATGTGDWTKDLVQLAKTAELKKHALTLQLHTAHILSAHAALDQKSRAIEDVREQKNRLESERKRLIECLAQINDDRTHADLLETSLERERTLLRGKIASLSEGNSEYALAKSEVDRLRADLGQLPLPSLQETLDGRGAGYLEQRRNAGPDADVKKRKRAANVNVNGVGAAADADADPSAKRPKGRPRASASAAA